MTAAVRVFRYGLRRPHEGFERVSDQMRAAHRYRNVLTHIEQGRREAVRAVMSEAGLRALEVAAEEASHAVAACLDELKKHRSTERSRKGGEHTRRLKDAKKVLADARRELAAKRKEVRDSEPVQREVDRIGALAGELQRSAREHCGVFWGTYLLIEDAMRAAAAAPLYDGERPNGPRFVAAPRAHQSVGQVGVQIQGGMAAEALFGEGTALRVRPVDERAWLSPVRGERRRLSRTVLSMRVGSENRAPIFAEWRMVMHRPLPAGARIKRATVNLGRIGPREEWSVALTVELPPGHRSAPGGEGAVAVDLGWRVRPGGLRVAAWYGPERVPAPGTAAPVEPSGELLLSERMIEGLRKPNGLRSTRDTNFDTARAALGAALAAAAPGEVPEWLARDTATMARWRDSDRLARLVRHWTATVWGPDADGQAAWHAAWRAYWEAERVLERAERGLQAAEAAGLGAAAVGPRDEARRAAAAALAAASSTPYPAGATALRGAHETAEAWRFHDHHLWQWESAQRKGSLRNRREHYRVFAARLARTYGTLVIEDFDLREVARRPADVDESPDNERARSNRQLAATSELRMALIQAFTARGGRVVKRNPAFTTLPCHVCGVTDAWDPAKELTHTCSGCGALWDQDDNAARNLYADWDAVPVPPDDAADGEPPPPAAAPEGRWERARRLADEKAVRTGAAPKAPKAAAPRRRGRKGDLVQTFHDLPAAV